MNNEKEMVKQLVAQVLDPEEQKSMIQTELERLQTDLATTNDPKEREKIKKEIELIKELASYPTPGVIGAH